jgi:hypothetical protein
MGETAFDASTNIREASTIFYFLRLRQDSFISAEPLFFDSRTMRYFCHEAHRVAHARYFIFVITRIVRLVHDTFTCKTLTPACAAAGARQSLIEDEALKLA